MAGGRQFVTLLHASSRSSLLKPTRSFFYNPVKHYGQASKGNFSQERAPSTAEEFQRVAEEKAREARERVAQNIDKAYDGAGDSKVESVKNRYKEHEPGADHRGTG